MERILRPYKILLGGVEKVERFLGILLLSIIVVCIFSQVISRYFFRRPLVWVEELATYCFIWGTFIGASLGLKHARHIIIRAIIDILSSKVRRALLFFTYFSIGALLCVLVYNGIKGMGIEAREYTIALPIRLSRKYFYSFPLTVGSVSMLVTTGYLILEEISRLRVKII